MSALGDYIIQSRMAHQQYPGLQDALFGSPGPNPIQVTPSLYDNPNVQSAQAQYDNQNAKGLYDPNVNGGPYSNGLLPQSQAQQLAPHFAGLDPMAGAPILSKLLSFETDPVAQADLQTRQLANRLAELNLIPQTMQTRAWQGLFGPAAQGQSAPMGLPGGQPTPQSSAMPQSPPLPLSRQARAPGLPPGMTPQIAMMVGPAGVAAAWNKFLGPRDLREGMSSQYYDPATGTSQILAQQPKVPVGSQYNPGTNMVSVIPGAPGAATTQAQAQAQGTNQANAANGKLDFVNGQGVNPYTGQQVGAPIPVQNQPSVDRNILMPILQKQGQGIPLSDSEQRILTELKPSAVAPDDPSVLGNARAIANYQLAPMTGYALRSPYGQAVMAKVMELRPDYQAQNFTMSQDAYKKFGAGPLGNQMRSFNVAFSHLNTLGTLADALQNGNVPAVNAIGNMIGQQFGSTAPTSFNAAKNIVADEITKAIIGSRGALGDRDKAQASVNQAQTPAQLKQVIETYKQLIAGQLTGIGRQYQKSTLRNDFSANLSDDVNSYMQQHGAGAGGIPAVQSPEEALKLAPGTTFRTPDGRLKVR